MHLYVKTNRILDVLVELLSTLSFFSQEITEVCGAQDNILTVKDKKIRDLKERLARQNKTRRIAENETKLRLQQERYLIGHDYANPENTELNREFNRFKGMLT